MSNPLLSILRITCFLIKKNNNNIKNGTGDLLYSLVGNVRALSTHDANVQLTYI